MEWNLGTDKAMLLPTLRAAWRVACGMERNEGRRWNWERGVVCWDWQGTKREMEGVIQRSI